jgi:hypothetical protein
MNRRLFLIGSGKSLLILPFLGIGTAFASEKEEKDKLKVRAGDLVISPDKYMSGEKVTFTCTYTAGEIGIAKNGFIKLLFPAIWSFPQNADPNKEGYTSCELVNLGNITFEEHLPDNQITVVLAGDLKPGEKIVVKYGDTAKGSGAVRITDFPWVDLAFPMLIDLDGTGTRIGKMLSNPIQIISGPASKVKVILPTTVRIQETVFVRTSVGDRFFNYPNPPIDYPITIKKQPGLVTLPIVKGEKALPVKFKKKGLTRILVVAENNQSESNPILVQEKKAPLNLYFGDLHGHSLGSDGLRSPEDYFSYGKEMSDLDVCILTDHAECIYPTNKYNWDYLIKTAEDYHRPGLFVTFPAFEWTHGGWGHRHVIYRDATIAANTGYFNSTYENANTPEKLYDLVRAAKPILVPHHTLATFKWEHHDPELEPLAEIYSMWGSSEYEGNPLWSLKLPAGSPVSKALNLGYKLGLVGSGDNHHGQPAQGLTQSKFMQLNHANGLAGIWAKELTREAIWAALKSRQTFATTGARIFVDFRINEQLMGSTIQSKGSDLCRWEIRGTDKIKSLEIVSNSNQVIYELTDFNSDEHKGDYSITPTSDNANKTSFYYLRIKQEDNNWAWTSPIWINRA